MSTERQLLVAELTGAAMHHARWEPPDDEQTAAAAAELTGILAGREDGPALLAEVAGVSLGFHEGGPGEPRARAVTAFCIAAGADESLVPQWVQTGRERARAASLPPFGAPRRIRPGQHPPNRGG